VTAAAQIRPRGGDAALAVAPGCREALARAALAAAPEECCGVLLGRDDRSGMPAILDIAAVANTAVGDRRRTFAVPAQELVEIRKRHRSEGLDIVGFFHSHPDGKAWPSASDVALASPWPGYLQAIVGLRDPDRLVIRFFRAHDRFWGELPVG
jgi:proteasome lid subunit RPN8/RPN11